MEGALETVTGVLRYRTDEEKRRMVEGTLASGESVAVMARHYGVNANQLFHWRKQYQAGLLGIAKRSGTKSDVQLLPVTVSDGRLSNRSTRSPALNHRQIRSTLSFRGVRW